MPNISGPKTIEHRQYHSVSFQPGQLAASLPLLHSSRADAVVVTPHPQMLVERAVQLTLATFNLDTQSVIHAVRGFELPGEVRYHQEGYGLIVLCYGFFI